MWTGLPAPPIATATAPSTEGSRHSQKRPRGSHRQDTNNSTVTNPAHIISRAVSVWDRRSALNLAMPLPACLDHLRQIVIMYYDFTK